MWLVYRLNIGRPNTWSSTPQLLRLLRILKLQRKKRNVSPVLLSCVLQHCLDEPVPLQTTRIAGQPSRPLPRLLSMAAGPNVPKSWAAHLAIKLQTLLRHTAPGGAVHMGDTRAARSGWGHPIPGAVRMQLAMVKPLRSCPGPRRMASPDLRHQPLSQSLIRLCCDALSRTCLGFQKPTEARAAARPLSEMSDPVQAAVTRASKAALSLRRPPPRVRLYSNLI